MPCFVIKGGLSITVQDPIVLQLTAENKEVRIHTGLEDNLLFAYFGYSIGRTGFAE